MYIVWGRIGGTNKELQIKAKRHCETIEQSFHGFLEACCAKWMVGGGRLNTMYTAFRVGIDTVVSAWLIAI